MWFRFLFLLFKEHTMRHIHFNPIAIRPYNGQIPLGWASHIQGSSMLGIELTGLHYASTFSFTWATSPAFLFNTFENNNRFNENDNIVITCNAIKYKKFQLYSSVWGFSQVGSWYCFQWPGMNKIYENK